MMEKMDVAMSIIGSAVASREVRKRASRVAFPLMNCAMTAAAQHIAMNVDWDLDLMTFALLTRHCGETPATLSRPITRV
jgi:hypothetical protein